MENATSNQSDRAKLAMLVGLYHYANLLTCGLLSLAAGFNPLTYQVAGFRAIYIPAYFAVVGTLCLIEGLWGSPTITWRKPKTVAV